MMESDKRTIDSTRPSAQVAFESSSFNFSHPDVRLSRRICAAGATALRTQDHVATCAASPPWARMASDPPNCAFRCAID